jgi:carbamoyl-phosphate synthase large subunit
LVAVCAGVALVLAAGVWRIVARRRVTAGIRRALLDSDPERRRAAVFLAAERGVGRFADLLLERTEQERSRLVRDALAEVVARSQWEPADRHEMVELRLWAHGQREEAAARPEPAPAPLAVVQPEPAPPTVSVKTADVSDHSSKMEDEVRDTVHTAPASDLGEGRRRSGAATSPARPAPRVRARARRAAVSVLVTGAGGPAGVAVIRALRAAGHHVIGADADGLAVGLRLAHDAVVLPAASDPDFVDSVCDAAEQRGAHALVSTVAEELVALAEMEHDLHGAGLSTWLPDPVAVDACIDKWRFAQVLEGCGLNGPRTALGTAEGVPGPWIVKPRRGRGSRGVHSVDRVDELAWVLPRVDEPIVQTRLDGREFTIDALVDRDGTVAAAVPRWRLETRSGVSTKGRTFTDEVLSKEAGSVLHAVGLTGPANVQGFVAVDGTPTFVEVNPRFSGGLPLALASGADLIGEYLRGVLGEPLRPDRLAFRPGLTMVRHYEEIFE